MFRTHRRVLDCMLGSCLILAVGGSVEAQRSGYIYVSNGTRSSVDVLRASDYVRIASMPTIAVPYGVAVSRDGRRVYASTFDGKNIYTFDSETNALISTLQFGSELREIALTPDDRSLYVPDYNENVVHIVSTRDNKLTRDVPVGVNPHMVAFGDHGKYAYVTNEAGESVTVIDTRTAAVVTTIPVGDTPIGIAASPDTRTIYVANYNGDEVSIISTRTQSVVDTVALPGNGKSVAASPDGKFVYAICDNPASGYVISVEDKSIVLNFPVGSQPRNVTVDPAGKTIYVTNFNSQDLYAIDATTYQLKDKKALGSLDGIAFSESARPLIEGYRFESVDCPYAHSTFVSQMNDRGLAVGWYTDGDQSHGFLYHRGKCTTYDFPTAYSTWFLGINSSNHVVGYFEDITGNQQGLQWYEGVGSRVELQIGGGTVSAEAVEVDGIDNEGSMVGSYYNPADFQIHAFRSDGTSIENIEHPGGYPGGPSIFLNGIAGELISGSFGTQGFILRGADEFSDFSFPGAGTAPDGNVGYTFGYKINYRGDLVGYWETELFGVTHGFLLEKEKHRYLSFDYPDSSSTVAYGINDVGQVTGSYLDANGVHGFIATPERRERERDRGWPTSRF